MADNNRFADAIKRIVEPLIPKQKGDDNYKSKSPIPGRRGIALNNGTTQTSSGASGAASAANTNRPRIITQATSDALQDAATKEALNSLGVLGAAQGSYDADALLTGEQSPAVANTVDAATLSALALNAEANSLGTATGGGRLLEITGLKDCATGKNYTVRTDGFFVPPASWETADNPPIDPTYLDGSVWKIISGATVIFTQTFSELISQRAALDSTVAYTVSAGIITSTDPQAGDPLIQFSTAGQLEGDPIVGGTGYSFTSSGTVSPGTYGRILCSSDAAAASVCALSPPKPDFWPVTGVSQLTRNSSGQFVASPYDSEVENKFKTPRSILALCTENDLPVRISPLKNGGFAFYEVDGSGAVTGVVQLYNADSSAAGFTDVAGLTRMTP